MKKQWAAVVVFLAFMVWQIVSPYYTVYQIKQAVEHNSSDELAQHINFSLLKRNLKIQLQDKIEEKILARQNGSFFGSLTYSIANKAIDSLLNRAVTPASIINLVSNIRSFEQDLNQLENWSGIGMPSSDNPDYQKVQMSHSIGMNDATITPHSNNVLSFSQPQHAHSSWHYQFDGLNQFSIVQQHAEYPPVRYVLTRSGLGWKLSNIILP